VIDDRIFTILLDLVKNDAPKPAQRSHATAAHMAQSESYLIYLRANPGALTADVAAAVGVEKHSAACYLGALEKRGRVTKQGKQGRRARWWVREASA